MIVLFVLLIVASLSPDVSGTLFRSRGDIQYSHPSNPRLPVSPEAYMTSVSCEQLFTSCAERVILVVMSSATRWFFRSSKSSRYDEKQI